MLHWAEETPGEFSVSADYEVQASVNSRLRRRGDAVSFVSQSRALALSTTGAGPIAVARSSNAEQVGPSLPPFATHPTAPPLSC